MQITGPSTSFERDHGLRHVLHPEPPPRRGARTRGPSAGRRPTAQTSVIYTNSFGVSGVDPGRRGHAADALVRARHRPRTPTRPQPDLGPAARGRATTASTSVRRRQYTEDGQPDLLRADLRRLLLRPTWTTRRSPRSSALPAVRVTTTGRSWPTTRQHPDRQGPLTTFTVADIATVTGHAARPRRLDQLDGTRRVHRPPAPTASTGPVRGRPDHAGAEVEPGPRGATYYMVYVSQDARFTNLLEPTNAIPATTNTMYAPALDNDAQHLSATSRR